MNRLEDRLRRDLRAQADHITPPSVPGLRLPGATRHQTRPLAVADVIRQGSGMHRRIITGGALTDAWVFRRARPGWRLAAAAGLVAALAGVLAGLVVASGSAARAPQVITVADLANLAATAAARQPDVRPGQWVYRKTLFNYDPWGYRKTFVSKGRFGPRLMTKEWWATADGGQEAFYDHGRLVVAPGLSSFAADLLPGRSFGSLPSDPRALVARVRRLACIRWPPLSPCPGYRLVVLNIGMALGDYVMPPKITAELYRALADIPGVRTNRNAVDLAGRHGIGFAYPVGFRTVEQIIINSRTYRFLGTYFRGGEGVHVPASTASGEALLRQVFVSGPGVRP